MATEPGVSLRAQHCQGSRCIVKDEFKAMLAQSEEKLRAARLLLDGGAWGDASSRAYCAAFYAVSAVLLSRGETY